METSLDYSLSSLFISEIYVLNSKSFLLTFCILYSSKKSSYTNVKKYRYKLHAKWPDPIIQLNKITTHKMLKLKNEGWGSGTD